MLKKSLIISAVLVASLSAATVQTSTFATGSSFTGPDSITSDGTSIYVEYGSGASSTGASGASTIVRYSLTGQILNTFTVPGSADGLRINPFTGQLWALQNQDGNSAVTIINPANGVQTYVTYAGTPANAATTPSMGFDDIVFTGALTAYLSRTNPSAADDAIIVSGTLSGAVINLAPVVLFGTTGATDPDSLKQDLNGNLVLSSGDDGFTLTVQNPGAAQTLLTQQLTDGGQNVSGLDDTAFTNAASGTLLVTDTPNNSVLALYVTGLTGSTEFASVGGSTRSVGIVNQTTGGVSTIGSFAPNAAPHGLLFIPDARITATPEPATMLFVGLGLAAFGFYRRKRD